jgi:hypothetical protein
MFRRQHKRAGVYMRNILTGAAAAALMLVATGANALTYT